MMMQRYLNYLFKLSLFFISLFPCGMLLAAPAIDPSLVAYAKSLSPEEQKRLAEQYGVTLPSTTVVKAPVGANRREETGAPIERAISEPIVKEVPAKNAEGLKRFGAGVFDGSGLQAPPSDDAMVPEHYLLGPGDAVIVTFYGKETLSVELIVDREGQLFVPRLGPVQVIGLTFSELKERLKQRVDEQLIGVDVMVAMSALRKINIFVAGEVGTPGSYNLSSLANVTHALYAAGGINAIGSLRNIQVRRDNKVSHTVDLYDLLLSGDRRGDVTLRNGDVIFVPVVTTMVSLRGKVLRPAVYELQEGQTFADIIRMAGGLLSDSFTASMVLKRQDATRGAPRVIGVRDAKSTLLLQNGDSIEVQASSTQILNPIEVEGAVVRPGNFEYFNGARVSDYISDYERDLLFQSDLDVGLIVRRANAQQDIEVVPFSPAAVLTTPGDLGDPLLQVFDRIAILPLPRPDQLDDIVADDESDEGFRSRRAIIDEIVEKLRAQTKQGETAQIVGISGAVRVPGEYPLLLGGDLGFLVDLAGGLAEGAALTEVEVRRQTKVDDRVTTTSLDLNLETDALDFELRGYDQVTVKYLQDWGIKDLVTVEGEVRFPGEYLLRPGERLSGLLNRAGGFTDQADIDAVRFRSASAREVQERALKKYVLQIQRSASLDEEVDTQEVVSDALTGLEVEGRVTINMPAILAGDPTEDLMLQDGDSLFVPKQSDIVFVVGEVQEPGAIRYSESLTVENYLVLAAGPTTRARDKDTYIILPSGEIQYQRANGRFLGFGSSTSRTLLPGSTIVVPPNLDYAKPLDLYTQVSTVVFQSVASIAAFFNIARN